MFEALLVSAGAKSPAGQIAITKLGVTSWTVPPDVTSISAVIVGPGNKTSGTRLGGAGGDLRYSIKFDVTPGETLDIYIATGGDGTFTYIRRQTDPADTYLLKAGTGGSVNSTPIGGVIGGGNGGAGGGGVGGSLGAGGGGAGGYAGKGGDGMSSDFSNGSQIYGGSAGVGGGGGGGGAYAGSGNQPIAGGGGGGGGVGLFGTGANGKLGVGGFLPYGGTGGSGGVDGGNGASAAVGAVGAGGNYGGGGGGGGIAPAAAGNGAARIIWGGGRAYPTTKVADV